MSKDVTPYMHILSYHVAESVRLNGNLSLFTIQGMEKLNDNVSRWYFRSTSFGRETALKQVMQKQNRIAYLANSNSKRKLKFNWKCKKCGECGHSTKRCSK